MEIRRHTLWWTPSDFHKIVCCCNGFALILVRYYSQRCSIYWTVVINQISMVLRSRYNIQGERHDVLEAQVARSSVAEELAMTSIMKYSSCLFYFRIEGWYKIYIHIYKILSLKSISLRYSKIFSLCCKMDKHVLSYVSPPGIGKRLWTTWMVIT